MADLATQDASAGLGGVSFVAASAGGDTAEAGVGAGGWRLCGVLLVSNASATLTRDVTVEGLAAVTVAISSTAAIPLNGGGIAGKRLAVTYTPETDLTVAAVHF